MPVPPPLHDPGRPGKPPRARQLTRCRLPPARPTASWTGRTGQPGCLPPRRCELSVLRFHVHLNLRVDITGDWFRDPWGWPEYDYVLDGHLDQLGARARATGTRRVAKIDVPKENFGIRPAVVLDPIDRMLFQGLVDMNTSKLIGKLSPWVHGWRLRREDPKSGDYSPNDVECGLVEQGPCSAACIRLAVASGVG